MDISERHAFLHEVADWIDANPDKYGYGWDKCIAAIVARKAGQSLSLSCYVNNVHVGYWAKDYLDLSEFDANELFIGMSGIDPTLHYSAHEVAAFVRRFAEDLDSE